MEISEQKNKPYTGKRSVPVFIFPDKMPPLIKKTFNKYAEY